MKDEKTQEKLQRQHTYENIVKKVKYVEQFSIKFPRLPNKLFPIFTTGGNTL